jgi:hypothetical protein
MPKCKAKLNYDVNKVLVQETTKEMNLDDEFSLEFPINIRKAVLKYSLKFVSIDAAEDDKAPSYEEFDKSAFQS